MKDGTLLNSLGYRNRKILPVPLHAVCIIMMHLQLV